MPRVLIFKFSGLLLTKMYKPIHMSYLKTYLLLAFISILASCQNDSQEEKEAATTQQQPQIAELLDRPAALQQGKEWERVQNKYVKHRDAILQQEDDAEDRLALAQVYIYEARVTGEHGHYYPAALGVLSGIPADHPNKDIRFRKLANQAGVQLSLHSFQEALTTAKAAVAINPYNAQIYGALVDAYVELGQYDKAVEMADKMVGIRPDLRSYARVSYLREIHGQVDAAIEAMELAVEAGYPGYEETAWARLTLAEMYQKYRSLEAAEMQYKQILSERPDYPFAIAALGDIEMQRGNYKEAERLLKKATGIIPEFGFYESLAALYKNTGRQQAFQSTMEELWVMLKEDTDSGHDMTLEYANLKHELEGAHKEALGYALKEYQKRPKNIDVNCTLAAIYSSLGQSEKASMHLQIASETNAQYPELKALQQQVALK